MLFTSFQRREIASLEKQTNFRNFENICNSDYLNFVTANSNYLLTLSISIIQEKSSAHPTKLLQKKKRKNSVKCEWKNFLEVKGIKFHRLTEYVEDKRVFQRNQKGQKDTNSMFVAVGTRYVSYTVPLVFKRLACISTLKISQQVRASD